MKNFKRILITLTLLSTVSFFTRCITSYNDEATEKLWHAIVNNDIVEAQKAIDQNANPNGRSFDNFLILAIKLHLPAIVNFLIFHKVNVNFIKPESRETALIIACKEAQPQIVKILVDAHVNYNHRDNANTTALEHAQDHLFYCTSSQQKALYQQCITIVRNRMMQDKLKSPKKILAK